MSERRSERNLPLGRFIRTFRERKRFTRAQVGGALGISDKTVQRMENEGLPPTQEQRDVLISLLNIPLERYDQIYADESNWIEHTKQRPQRPELPCLDCAVPDIPASGLANYIKTYAIEGFELRSAHQLFGNCTDPLHLFIRYHPELKTRAPEIHDIYPKLILQLEEENRHRRKTLWDGATVRLIGYDFFLNRAEPDGTEIQVVTLHLGPESWFDFQALNDRFIDEPNLIGTKSLRQAFADPYRVVHSGGDLSWYRLSSILCVPIIPLTSDGYGLLQLRSSGSVSTQEGKFTSGIAENMHPHWDEAYPDDLSRRIHELRPPRGRPKIMRGYEPSGIPNPLLTAQRGMYEELSYKLGLEIPLECYKFLNMCWDLESCQPALLGIVHTGLSKEDLKQAISRTRGRDHYEYDGLHFLPLDPHAAEVREILSQRFTSMGLAAFITAINYWQDRTC